MNEAQVRERLRDAVGEARPPAYLSSRVEARLDLPAPGQVERTASLVAVLLVVLVISALVVGLHVWPKGLNIRPAPAGQAMPSPASFVSMTPPPGGPVPAPLLGKWLLPPAAVAVIQGCNSPCGSVELTFTATTYQLTPINNDLYGKFNPGLGDVVVNNSEIDFFNGVGCYQPAGFDGAGRYRWTITGGKLHLTPLNPDPECGRTVYLANQSFSRTS